VKRDGIGRFMEQTIEFIYIYALICVFFDTSFLKTDGVTPIFFLNETLKEDRELNPHSYAIPAMDRYSFSGSRSIFFDSCIRYALIKFVKF